MTRLGFLLQSARRFDGAFLVVVIYGTALEYGIDLDAVLEEVHRSNQPPNIAAVLGL